MSTAQSTPAEGEPRLQVFLSHSSEDKQVVRELYERLKRDGFAPWLDEVNILPGQKWQEEISAAVRKSDVVIVCLSRKSVDKEGYLQHEIRDAIYVAEEKPEGTIFIIPARLEQVEIPKRLGQWQWADLFLDAGYELLVAALNRRAVALGLPQNSSTVDRRPLQPRRHSSAWKSRKWLYAIAVVILAAIAVVIAARRSGLGLSSGELNSKGDAYYYGHGVEQDYIEARRWYEKAAAGGNTDAMNHLGRIYHEGYGVTKDYQQARSWFEKAANVGNVPAMFNLGFMYEQGQGVARDLQQARFWYQKAAEGGYEDAKKALQEIPK